MRDHDRMGPAVHAPWVGRSAAHATRREGRPDLAAVTEFIRNKAGAQETYSRIILREVRLGDAEARLTSRAAAAPPRRP